MNQEIRICRRTSILLCVAILILLAQAGGIFFSLPPEARAEMPRALKICLGVASGLGGIAIALVVAMLLYERSVRRFRKALRDASDAHLRDLSGWLD